MTFNTVKPTDGATDSQRIQNLYKYLNQLADKLNYALNNLDDQNLTQTFLSSLQKDETVESVEKSQSNSLLYSGSADVGTCITFPDYASKYRFLLMRTSNSPAHVLCPVYSKDGSIIVSGSYSAIVGQDTVGIWSVSGMCSKNTLSLDYCTFALIKNGIVTMNNGNAITRIWGIR